MMVQSIVLMVLARRLERASLFKLSAHAQSIDVLNISMPGTFCSSGGKHATFGGMADVIRPTGTTTEPFRVDVDDCGEPGTMDTFGIKTTSYMNGPSRLIGGSIMIH